MSDEQEYVVTVCSAKLMGSVRILGDLPPAMPHVEAEKFVAAIQSVMDMHTFDGKGQAIVTLKGCKYV